MGAGDVPGGEDHDPHDEPERGAHAEVADHASVEAVDHDGAAADEHQREGPDGVGERAPHERAADVHDFLISHRPSFGPGLRGRLFRFPGAQCRILGESPQGVFTMARSRPSMAAGSWRGRMARRLLAAPAAAQEER